MENLIKKFMTIFKDLPRFYLIAAGFILALVIVFGVYRLFFPRDGPKPLFANSKSIDPEAGGREGWRIDMITRKDGTTVWYDDSFNILVIGVKDDPSELLMLPGEWGNRMTSGIQGGKSIVLPFWKDSIVVYDKSGLKRVIFLQSQKAKDLFHKCEAGPESFIEEMITYPQPSI